MTAILLVYNKINTSKITFTRFQDVNTIVYNTQYVKNACNYGVLHSKGSQFSAICNYLFVLGPGSGTDS